MAGDPSVPDRSSTSGGLAQDLAPESLQKPAERGPTPNGESLQSGRIWTTPLALWLLLLAFATLLAFRTLGNLFAHAWHQWEFVAALASALFYPFALHYVPVTLQRHGKTLAAVLPASSHTYTATLLREKVPGALFFFVTAVVSAEAFLDFRAEPRTLILIKLILAGLAFLSLFSGDLLLLIHLRHAPREPVDNKAAIASWQHEFHDHTLLVDAPFVFAYVVLLGYLLLGAWDSTDATLEAFFGGASALEVLVRSSVHAVSLSGLTSQKEVTTAVRPGGARGLAWVLPAVLVVLAIVPGVPPRPLAPRPVADFMRLNVALPLSAPLSSAAVPTMALSPNGRRLVYVAQLPDGTEQLYTRAIYTRHTGHVEPLPIPGTEGGSQPFFSPDGTKLGFHADGKLKIVDLEDGSRGPVTLCAAPRLRGATWGPQGILFAPDIGSGLFLADPASREVKTTTVPSADAAGTSHCWPQFLPGGNAALFNVSGPGRKWLVAVHDLANAKTTILFEGGIYPRYSATGHVLFGHSLSLVAVAFDLKTLAVTGNRIPVLDGVRMFPDKTGAAFFDLSGSGTLVYVVGYTKPRARELHWVNRSGQSTGLITAERQPYQRPALSRGGKRMAVSIQGPEGPEADLWIIEPDGKMRAITNSADNDDAAWCPHGDRMYYSSNAAAGSWNAWSTPTEGGVPVQLTEGDNWVYPTSLSPDGRLLACAQQNVGTGWDIGILEVTEAASGSRKLSPRLILKTDVDETYATFSPNGKLLAYVSNESGKAGRREVYVCPVAGGGRWRISSDGGTEPAWGRDGSELFYRTEDAMMAVPVQTEPAFSHGEPRRIFEDRYERGPLGFANYDVAKARRRVRFAMIRADYELELVIAPDWGHEILTKAPEHEAHSGAAPSVGLGKQP